uniref:Uncharacterized protein n=1 Tax=Solanum tuberosum TaxID=4113 RepID=M1DCI0_SOLTU
MALNHVSDNERQSCRMERCPDHGLSVVAVDGIWIEEHSKDTNRQKGTKQTEEVEKGEPNDRQDHSTTRRVALQST